MLNGDVVSMVMAYTRLTLRFFFLFAALSFVCLCDRVCARTCLCVYVCLWVCIFVCLFVYALVYSMRSCVCV